MPDYVLRIFNPSYKAAFHANTFVYIFWLCTSMLMVKSGRFFYAALGLLWALVTAGFFYWLHFGRYFMRQDIHLLFAETEDVALAFASDLFKDGLILVPIALAVFLGITIRRRAEKRTVMSNWFIAAFAGVLLLQPYFIYRHGELDNAPSPVRYMAHNAMRSIAAWSVVSNRKVDAKFLLYKAEKAGPPPGKTTFILYMGESANWRHMSLFGYGRDTTPRLDEWKRKGRLLYWPAYSSSVTTGVSLPLFLNMQKEPENWRMTVEKRFNLFRLARENGFRTVLYSPQSSKTFPNIGLEFIDRAAYRDTERKKFNKYGDDHAFELLKGTKFGERNFIVVQTRATHYPYENIYKNLPQFDVWRDEGVDFRINSYDNAMLYLDDLLGRVLEFASTLEGRVYVLITSDHGQMMGGGGLWGHSFLHEGVAEVPFILWTKGVPEEEMYGMDEVAPPISHYDMSKFVARVLGVKVENPNTPDDEFYINGPQIDGSMGFYKYKKKGGKAVKIGEYDGN
jgi:glucan phosphoethanolaminetransferase (alkaline phosphatase superfamily)